MSDNAEAVESVDTPADETVSTSADNPAEDVHAEGVQDTDTPDDDHDAGNREAARYRRRLRETEQERDRLTQQVEALQRSEVERAAAAEQIKPAALWSVTELADLLAEDGTVDADKLTAGIKSARDVLGLPAPRRNHVPGEGRNPIGSSRSAPRDDMVNVVMGRGGLD